MQIQSPIRHENSFIRRKKSSEEGYMLLAVVCMLAIMTIWLAVAIPDVAKSIQHDREVETMHRGKQYIRAIQLYYRKFGAYPPSADALVNTNNIRFLRKKYVDPMTRKDDWKPVYFGQNKAPLAMGFFGEPLGGGMNGASPIAGVGPSGTGGMPGQTGFGGTGFGGPNGGGSSGIGAGSVMSFGGGSSDNGSTVPAGATDNSGNTGGTSGTGSAGTGSGTGFMSGQNGQTMGGGGIVGVEPPLAKQSILVYKKKNHYNEWEFTYSPLQEMKQIAGGNTGIGQPVGNGVGGQSPTSPTPNQSIGSSPNPMQPTPSPPDQ